MDDESGRMWLEELLNQPYCFWGGLPPCPNCGSSHGDPEATPEWDQELRAWREEALKRKAAGDPLPPFPEKPRR